MSSQNDALEKAYKKKSGFDQMASMHFELSDRYLAWVKVEDTTEIIISIALCGLTFFDFEKFGSHIPVDMTLIIGFISIFLLKDQLSIFNIPKENPTIDDILALMDSFGIPYKAVVLRLYECGLIKRAKALELLSVEGDEVEKRSILTGKARRWLKRDRGVENFGSLLVNIEFNKEHDFLTESRSADDEAYVKSLIETTENK